MITVEDKERLFAAFANGRGQDTQDRKALGTEFGLHERTVAYHRGTWQQAQMAAAKPAVTQLAEEHQPVATNVVESGADFRDPEDRKMVMSTGGTWVDLSPESGGFIDPLRVPPPMLVPPQFPTDQPVSAANAAPVKERVAEPVVTPVPAGERQAEAAVADGPIEDRPPVAVAAVSASEPVQPPAGPVPGHSVPQLPQVGEIVEGQVDRVEETFALVELIGYTLPGTDRPLRGRLYIKELLRKGWCRDVREHLMAGDMVNVKVLDVELPPLTGGRLKVALSSKQAHAHPRERVPLEHEGGQSGGARQGTAEVPSVARDTKQETAEEPIVARGADVAATLTDLPVPTVNLKGSGTPAVQQPALTPQTVAPAQTPSAAQLASPSTSHDYPGLCATCLHARDRMCPYPDALEETYQLSDEQLHERHKSAVILFGRRPVIRCDYYREGHDPT